MPTLVRIPTPLRNLTQGAAEIQADGSTIKAIIENIESQFPGVKDRLCEDDGKIRRFINIYVNDEDIRFMNAEDTAVKAEDEISILPAIAGG